MQYFPILFGHGVPFAMKSFATTRLCGVSSGKHCSLKYLPTVSMCRTCGPEALPEVELLRFIDAIIA